MFQRDKNWDKLRSDPNFKVSCRKPSNTGINTPNYSLTQIFNVLADTPHCPSTQTSAPEPGSPLSYELVWIFAWPVFNSNLSLCNAANSGVRVHCMICSASVFTLLVIRSVSMFIESKRAGAETFLVCSGVNHQAVFFTEVREVFRHHPHSTKSGSEQRKRLL